MRVFATSGAFARMALLFVAVAFASSCAVNPVTGERELMLVSEKEELELGDRAYAGAMWSSIGGGGEYLAPDLEAYLKEIVVDLHGASHRPELPVTFSVQNSSIPNAWALPGHVVMTRGLLAGLESEAEFAFVMGHEIGHVSARHTASRLSYRMIQAVGLAAAGTALADEEYGRGALALGAAGSTLLLLKYSRDDELEADRLGVEYMAEVGYRPENAALAHKNLEKAVTSYMESIGTDPRRRSFFEELLSTHPRTSVRIDEIEEMTGGVEPGPLRGDGARSERFTEMTAGLREANRVYREHYDPAVTAYGEGDFDRAEVLVGRAISEDPGQAPFFALKGYIALERKEYAEAEPLFREALSLHSGYQPALRGAGIQAYFAEEYAGAVQVLTRALEILPGDLSARFYLGMSHMKGGRYSRAVEHLGAYAEAKPGDPRVHYYLGYSYENAGKPGEAYTEYIRQLRVEPDNEEGRLALERAREIEVPAERPEVMPWEKDRLR